MSGNNLREKKVNHEKVAKKLGKEVDQLKKQITMLKGQLARRNKTIVEYENHQNNVLDSLEKKIEQLVRESQELQQRNDGLSTSGQGNGPSTSGQGYGPSTSGQDDSLSTSGQAYGPLTSGQAYGPSTSSQDDGPSTSDH